jgi:hypothetical protein
MSGRECLCCGQVRIAHPTGEDACGRCGYVGWAPTRTLTEDERRRLRDRPLSVLPHPRTETSSFSSSPPFTVRSSTVPVPRT